MQLITLPEPAKLADYTDQPISQLVTDHVITPFGRLENGAPVFAETDVEEIKMIIVKYFDCPARAWERHCQDQARFVRHGNPAFPWRHV
jgi:hypothetical protein